MFLIEFYVFIPYTYIVSYALQSGFKPHRAHLLKVLLNVGAVPGRALPGYAADRFGSFNTRCLTLLCCAVFIWGFWLTAKDNQTQSIAFTILLWFWSGATICLTPVSISRVCRIEYYRKRSGTTFFVASFGALVGVPIAGAIVDMMDGDYFGLLIFGGVIYTTALVSFIFTRGFVGGWKPALA